MKPEAQKFLWDAADALQRIGQFVAGQTLESYLADIMRRSAVERQFEILGEALNQCCRVEPSIADAIPDLPRIVAFRNMLIHGYSTVDDTLVWEIAATRTADLLARLQRLQKL
ncbi:MAG: DUF86 domain-containing protein [Rhodocyclaceae bacterium]|nr:DUF86 domain-containing protein [Rhodocyclaceae bacterium]